MQLTPSLVPQPTCYGVRWGPCLVNARLGFFVPFVMQSSFDLLLFPIVYFFGCQPLFANSLCFILALDELRDKINEKMTDHFLS